MGNWFFADFNWFEKFRETAKSLIVYPSKHVILLKQNLYLSLTEKQIKDKDCEHAEKIWSHFACMTLGECSDLYLKIDVLLFASAFENFRDICIST